jgi:hypothetical protein
MAKEIPYSKIDPREMQELETEFGRTLTPELAQCLIRYRINRDAIELMLRRESAAGSAAPSEIKPKPASKSEDLNEDTESEDQLGSRQPGARRAARKAVA